MGYSYYSTANNDVFILPRITLGAQNRAIDARRAVCVRRGACISFIVLPGSSATGAATPSHAARTRLNHASVFSSEAGLEQRYQDLPVSSVSILVWSPARAAAHSSGGGSQDS